MLITHLFSRRRATPTHAPFVKGLCKMQTHTSVLDKIAAWLERVFGSRTPAPVPVPVPVRSPRRR
jgi:hypothetical protein